MEAQNNKNIKIVKFGGTGKPLLPQMNPSSHLAEAIRLIYESEGVLVHRKNFAAVKAEQELLRTI